MRPALSLLEQHDVVPDACSKQNSVRVVLEAVAEVLDDEYSHRLFPFHWFSERTSAPAHFYLSIGGETLRNLATFTRAYAALTDSALRGYISSCKHD